MSQSTQTRLKPSPAASQLDALLTRAVRADKRANKPSEGAGPAGLSPASPSLPSPATVSAEPSQAMPHDGGGEGEPKVRQEVLPLVRLHRLTVRYTQDEAKLLERARSAAREMGYKLSDTAVFRLALNVFKPEAVTTAGLKNVLATDNRRKHG